MENIGLCTFPDDDKYYCKYFVVPKDWLIDTLEDVSLEEFSDSYTWDETWFVYEFAKNDGKLISENEEA